MFSTTAARSNVSGSPSTLKLSEVTDPAVSSGSPLPRPRAHSNFFKANASKIKALFRRVCCALKECSLDGKARAQKKININDSIHELITKKYDLKSWPSRLNAVCRDAEDHAIDVPSAVYKALGKILPVQLAEVSNLASNDSSLKWLAGMIHELTISRAGLQKELADGIGESYKFFKNGTKLAATVNQQTLWKAVIEKCENMAILQSDLEDAVKMALRKTSLGPLISIVEVCNSKKFSNRSFIANLKDAALTELASRGKPLFHSAWLDLSEKELKCIGNMIRKEARFNDWKDTYNSEVAIAGFMKKSDSEIIDLLKKQEIISPELKCVARLRMNRLRDKGVNALSRAVITRTGSLKSPCHLIPALLILDENIQRLNRYKVAIDEDFALRLEGAFSEVSSEDREIALGCLKLAVGEIKKSGKNLDGEVTAFCSSGAPAACDDGDADSLKLSINRMFALSRNSGIDKIPTVRIDNKITSVLTTEINQETKKAVADEMLNQLNDGVSKQFKNDLRTYHFSIDGVPFDGFNQENPDQATVDFKKQMNALGANEKQILVASELLAQTTGNLLWNRLIADEKLLKMTQEEITVSGLEVDIDDAYFIPGNPIQEKFVTAKYGQEIHIESHIFAERLDRLGVPGYAVATDPAKTHCLVKISIFIDIEGNVLISDVEAKFSRKVLGGAGDIE